MYRRILTCMRREWARGGRGFERKLLAHASVQEENASEHKTNLKGILPREASLANHFSESITVGQYQILCVKSFVCVLVCGCGCSVVPSRVRGQCLFALFYAQPLGPRGTAHKCRGDLPSERRMITTSPARMLRPSRMNSVPSVHVLGIGEPISVGFRTAFMPIPATPVGATSGDLRSLTNEVSLALPVVCGADPVKAERPGSDGTLNACAFGASKPRMTAEARNQTAQTAWRRLEDAMVAAPAVSTRAASARGCLRLPETRTARGFAAAVRYKVF